MSFLFWTYILNALLLINHEIDSAYWNEWKLFRMKGGIGGFLAFNVIAVFIAIVGIVPVYLQTFAGVIFSWLMALTGILTFCIHITFMAKGRKEFKTFPSLVILSGILIVSILEIIAILL